MKKRTPHFCKSRQQAKDNTRGSRFYLKWCHAPMGQFKNIDRVQKWNVPVKNTDRAYLLWCLSFLGFAGIHRFYLAKPISGLIWFVTWGLFGIGQLIDLFLIPSMVREQNLKYEALYGFKPTTEISGFKSDSLPEAQSDLHVILNLLKETKEATLADCVLATKKDLKTVRDLLFQMQCDELIEVGNRENDGTVVYRMV